jgi:hypothetical protein
MVLLSDEEEQLIRSKLKDQLQSGKSVLKSSVLGTFNDILGYDMKPELHDRLNKFLKDHPQNEVNIEELLNEGKIYTFQY